MPHCKKQMISFFLTTKCNLNCIYCYNIEERMTLHEKTLSLDIAKAGIDYFFANNSSRHIRFYGPGEPSQEFQLMKEITEYAKMQNENVTTEIQTNGVFGKSVREWMLNNINIIWMSFDGPPDIQNDNRPVAGRFPSAPIIEENVRWFNSNKGGNTIMVGARITITDKNIDRQIEMIDYFYDLGIRYAWTDPLFPAVGRHPVCQDEVEKKLYFFDMDRYIDNYIIAYRYAREKGFFYGSFLICNFDGESELNCRACTPTPHLTPDGYVSACDMVVLGENAYHMDCFIFGKWSDVNKAFIFDEKKIAALKSRTCCNISHCNNCDVKLHCGGYCLGEIVNETGSLDGQKPIICDAIRRLYNEIGVCDKFDFLHP